ncbi:MAG: DUF3502 domain-containing protein [Clostridia bacterium]|nr:DUF3502 domain-containing protein [Clostridia bacterium]
MKKLLSFALALVLCLSAASWAFAADDMSEEANLVFYVMGDAPKDEAVVEEAINAVLKEKFNATIDFQFSTWTDFNQKYNNTLISAGADLIYVANWENYGLNATSGAFLELDELLDTYGAELKELCGEGNLNMCRVNGDLYCIPALWPEYVSLGIKYREDLRAKYDLPYPTTLENIEAYLNGIKAADPSQGLLRPTNTESASSLIIGFDTAYLLADKYAWVAPFGMPYGLAADYDTPADVYDYWFSDDFEEDCKLFKSWADQGFWSKSALSDTNDNEAYDNGLAVAEVAGMNPNKQISSANSFAKDHPDWESAYIAYGENTGVIYPGHATQNGTAILRSSKYPERCMMILNYIMTDEAMNCLVQYGIEGKHYELDADGFYHNLDDSFAYEGFNTWNLRVNEFKLKQPTDVALQAMFDKYAELGAQTKWPNINIWDGFTEDYTDYSAERAAVANVMRQYLAPLQAGLVSDVDAAVEEFRAKVTDAGLEACREGFQEQWADYCEEYNYQ